MENLKNAYFGEVKILKIQKIKKLSLLENETKLLHSSSFYNDSI